MKFEKFDIVEVNNESFIVLNVIEYNENTYLYLINEKEEDDSCAVVKVIKDAEGILFESITEHELDIIMDKLLIENKDEIKEINNNKENEA